MKDKLLEIKRKLNNDKLENESDEYLIFDEYLTTDDVEWLIEKFEQLQEEVKDQTEWADLYSKELQTYNRLCEERGKTILELKREIESIKKELKHTFD